MTDTLKKFVERNKADRLRYISLLPDDGWSWCEGCSEGLAEDIAAYREKVKP